MHCEFITWTIKTGGSVMKFKLVIESETLDEITTVIKDLHLSMGVLITGKEECLAIQVKDPDTGEIHRLNQSPSKTLKRNCKQCGAEFDPPRKNSMFCSKTCYMKDYWKKHDKEESKKKPR